LNDLIKIQVSKIQEQSNLINNLENQLSQNGALLSQIQDLQLFNNMDSRIENQIIFSPIKHNKIIDQINADFINRVVTLNVLHI
jgi:hypothetical protein